MHCKETYQSLKLLQEVGEPIKLLKSLHKPQREEWSDYATAPCSRPHSQADHSRKLTTPTN